MLPPRELRRFVESRSEVEAVLQHVGLRTWDLLLVDAEGNWTRDEFESREAAEGCCRDLGVQLSSGWDDPRIARRMNARDHWNRPGGRRRAV